MSDIHVEPVWETDRYWEDHDPRFRVYFHKGIQDETGGWTTVYDITGADVLQVIDWAQRHATGTMTWSVALVVDDDAREEADPGYGRGLVWLVGVDGNDRSPEFEAAQQRMLQRRETPIQIPTIDRMGDEHNIQLLDE